MTDYSLLATKSRRRKKTYEALAWVNVALAIACLIGIVVCFIVMGVNEKEEYLRYLVCGILLAVLFICGLLGALLMRKCEGLSLEEINYLELAREEDCFCVGDGVFAYFTHNQLKIEGAGKSNLAIPYAEMRFFSVCTRKKPKQEGEWSVVMEIPSHYLHKGQKKGREKSLVQTDAKPRLYDCLKKYSLPLIGELPSEEKREFEKVKHFFLPDLTRRKRALISALIGSLTSIAGILVGIFWNATVGAFVGVFGGYLVLRGAFDFVRAKGALVVYREGIFWRDAAIEGCLFLKWEEIERITVEQEEKGVFFSLSCAYGAYRLPFIREACDFIVEFVPEKCKEIK